MTSWMTKTVTPCRHRHGPGWCACISSSSVCVPSERFKLSTVLFACVGLGVHLCQLLCCVGATRADHKQCRVCVLQSAQSPHQRQEPDVRERCHIATWHQWLVVTRRRVVIATDVSIISSFDTTNAVDDVTDQRHCTTVRFLCKLPLLSFPEDFIAPLELPI